MANRQLTLTLPEETLRTIESQVASGRYSDANEVVQSGVASLQTEEEWFTDWIRREAIPALEELEADPTSGSSLEQILADIREQEASHLHKAG